MLNVEELKPRVHEVTLSATVTASDIDQMKRALTPALGVEGEMGMVVRIESLNDITDKQAFAALLNRFDPVVPMISSHTFAPAKVDAARNWADDLPEAPKDAGLGRHVVTPMACTHSRLAER